MDNPEGMQVTFRSRGESDDGEDYRSGVLSPSTLIYLQEEIGVALSWFITTLGCVNVYLLIFQQQWNNFIYWMLLFFFFKEKKVVNKS